MDWSLVLFSQGIEVSTDLVEGKSGVLVAEPDLRRALNHLVLWQQENRGWKWRRTVPGSTFLFHWGSAFWVLSIMALYGWSLRPAIKNAGMMDNVAVASGQWWRLFTAVTLHADIPHLASNASMGFLLLGLAMARYGPGVALLAAFLAGAGGNMAGLFLHTEEYHGLGASGMVTGTLGLITVPSLVSWWKHPAAGRLVLRGLAAGFLVLVLTGFTPGTDIVAHAGGFVFGVLLGGGLTTVSQKTLRDKLLNLACGTILMALIVLAWRLALDQ